MRLVSTRSARTRASFTEAVQACVPADGGLYVPDPVACFRDLPRLLEMDFLPRCTETLHRLLGDEFGREEIDEVVREAFDFPLPLTQLQERVFALELFHGPTLAFQDFGARFLAGMLALVSDREGLKLRTVLTASTGNTGAAAAQAFWKRKGVRAVVLHPKGTLTALQERQIGGLDANVLSYAVEGSYDDCLALVLRALQDPELVRELNLTSANAVNIGRILGQMVLAFEAVARIQARSLRDIPVLAIPCGSCGNLYAALLAQRMGLPVKAFVIATNGNDTVPRALDTGRYDPRRIEGTLSQAMDVGHAVHWERVQSLYAGKPEALRAAFRWGSLDEAETRKAMWELNAGGFPPDPHTAVAYGVLQERLGLSEVGILLATAHPAKSAALLRNKMNLSLEMPEALAGLENRPVQAKDLPADFEALKNELLH